jgi:hypothetical protein
MNKTKISIFKDLFKSKDIPYLITLEDALERIKIGKNKELIESIRIETDKELRNKLKTKLPCILFAGTFKERSKKGLINHSGLMIIDFDGFKDKNELTKQIEELQQNKHIVTTFISPSDNGFKALVKIPVCNSFEHEKYFKAFYKEFNYNYFDISNCNVDRVCYESYDPNIYYNYKAEEYTPKLIDDGFVVTERVPLIPIDNEDVIIEKIMSFDWQKDFVDGQRNSYLLDVAGAFCEYNISQSRAEQYIINNVIHGEFSESEALTTIKSAYRLRTPGSKYFEDWQKIDSIKIDLKKGKKEVLSKHKIDEDIYNELKEVVEADDFWFINKKGNPQVSPLKYKLFLERNGFKKHFPNGSEKPSFVFIESNKVEITSIAKIKDFVLDYLVDRKEIDVWNYVANYQNLFSENYLLMLESIDLIMLNDTRNKSYIAFENGILEVTKESINLIDYIDVDGYIWRSHILDRDWKHLDDYTNDYEKFISNISSKEPLPIECVIGYMICTYKNRSNNKAIILNDEVISDNPEGGTGKGVFVQGLSQIRNTSIIDGKQFDNKKSFAYQTVSLDTRVLVFDDVKKNFDFESNFSLVTEGITIERKNKDAIKLNIHDSPKLILSTNYAIRGEGNSHDRRRHEIEFSQYYGKDLIPRDEFKKDLFDDWDLDEFQRFDNYMVYCLQTFLNNGLIRQNAKNIKLRKFIAETSMEFYEWVEDLENFRIGIKNDKVGKFVEFTEQYQDYKKWLSRKRFNIWVKKYATFKNLDYLDKPKWFCIGELKMDNEAPF